jgi:multiple sugar transport system substrate-binding protein
MNDRSPEPANRSLSRRSALQATGALLAASAGARTGRAQAIKTLQVWTGQSSREQQKAFEAMAADFEAAHPGVTVALQTVSDDDAWPKLLAGYAAGQPPDMCFNLNPVVAVALQSKGLLEPLNDTAAAIAGLDRRMLQTFNDRGDQFAIGVVRTVISTMWTRRDLFEAAGVEVPQYWDQHLAAARKLTGRGVYGLVLPYGKTVFSNIVVDMFVRQAGGDIVAPDGSPAFNGPGTVRALTFLKELRPFCPTGANSYGFSDTLNAFTSGATAIGMYTGRTLSEIDQRNPALIDQVDAAPYPYPRDGIAWWTSAYLPVFVCKGPKVSVPEAKAFIATFFAPRHYVDFLHGAPGHGLPVIAAIQDSEAYKDNPVLRRHPQQIKVIEEIAAKAWTNIKPSDRHPVQFRMGDIYGANILSGALQRVVIDGQSPEAAAGWGQDQIAQVLKS